jgi:hypothetical protein
MIQFILGAVAGGLAAWWWRGDIQNYVDQTLPNMREKTADRLAAIEQRAEEALSRARNQIDRMRPSGDQRSRDTAGSRSSGTYSQGV